MMKRYSPRLSFFEVLFGIIIGFIAVSFLTREKVEFENLAMGKTTTPYFASSGDHSIHLDQFSKKAVEDIVAVPDSSWNLFRKDSRGFSRAFSLKLSLPIISPLWWMRVMVWRRGHGCVDTGFLIWP